MPEATRHQRGADVRPNFGWVEEAARRATVQATGGGVAGAVLMAIYYERLISGTALQRLPRTLRMCTT